MAKTKDQKHQLKDEMAEKIGKANSVYFADYKGLTMKQLSDLRDKLVAENAEFAVTKNTILNIALKEKNLKTNDDSIESGPTATLFSYGDEISPLKLLVKALKDAGMGKMKAGFIGADYLDANSVIRLSALPGKQELQAKVVGSLASPLYGLVNVLQGNIRNLVYALDAIRKSKGGE